jgi:hypothetical protein
MVNAIRVARDAVVAGVVARLTDAARTGGSGE